MNLNTVRPTNRTGRRVAALSVAAVVAGLALAPAGAHAQTASDGGGTTTVTTGDKWSYMYDGALRRDVQVRDAAVQRTSDGYPGVRAASDAPVNVWDYMYDAIDARKAQAAQDRLKATEPPEQPVYERKQHKALAHIVLSVTGSKKAAQSTCYLPDSLDAWSRRVIAVQMCDKAEVVPAVFVARVPFGGSSTYSLGHL